MVLLLGALDLGDLSFAFAFVCGFCSLAFGFVVCAFRFGIWDGLVVFGVCFSVSFVLFALIVVFECCGFRCLDYGCLCCYLTICLRFWVLLVFGFVGI